MASGSETAFVTGGSGFIGGRLIRRLVADGVAVRALARSESSAAKVAALGARGGTRRPRRRRRDGVRRRGLRPGLPPRRARRPSGARWRSSSAATSAAPATRSRPAARSGVASFVHCGTEAAILAGQALHGADETEPLRPDSPGPVLGDEGEGRGAGPRGERRRPRDGRRAAALRVGGRRYDAAARDRRRGRVRQVRLGRRWRTPDLHHPCRQRRRGAGPRRRAGGRRRGLLRHRRRAGGVPRVHHRAAARPRGRASRPHRARLGRRARSPAAARRRGSCSR